MDSCNSKASIFTLGQFSLEEIKRTWCDEELVGMPHNTEIYNRFKLYYDKHKDLPEMEMNLTDQLGQLEYL